MDFFCFPVNERMAESVKIAQSMSEVAADNVLVSQKDETFELSLLEAIGTLHTEQMIASLKRPLVLEKPKVIYSLFTYMHTITVIAVLVY